MFGRRVVVKLRFPLQPRLPLPTPFQPQPDAASRALLCQTRRTYATPGRPRNIVGEPSKPVKRAAKRSAAKATSPDSSAKKKNAEKETKSAAKKSAVKKAAPKKELTEVQKAAKAAKLDKAKVAELKKAALEPPVIRTAHAYNFFFVERAKQPHALADKGESPERVRQLLGEHGKATGAAWKECSAADVEHYNHLAHTAREKSQAEYKRWVKSHTPEEIQVANRARLLLRRKLSTKGKSKWSLIKDERAAKRPVTAFVQFCVNRQASGDFKNIRLGERMKLIAQEWKALGEEEKRKYKTLQEEDIKRYTDEYSSVYGHPPSGMNGMHEQPPAAAAAAA